MNRRERFELKLGRAEWTLSQRVIRRVTGMRAYETTIDGVRVPYLRGGHGPLLLLVHGFGDRKETFGPLATTLFRRFELLIPDMPGFGDASSVASERTSPPAQSRHLARLLAALGIDHAHVCGQSMGGALVARFADDHPHLVRSLTLISAAGPKLLAPELDAVIAQGRNPLLVRTLADFEELVALGFERPMLYPREMRRLLAHMWAQRTDELIGHFDRFMNPPPDEAVATSYSNIRVPTQLIYGTHERLVHPDNAAAYRNGIAGARLHTLRGVGHNPHHEATITVGRLVRRLANQAG